MSDDYIRPPKIRLIEARTLCDTPAKLAGGFKQRFKAVESPPNRLCVCGRMIVWDAYCLKCQRDIMEYSGVSGG